MPRFKLESLDVNFEYQEKLLKSVEQGIKETKKKLNDTEIMLTLEPNKVDLQEWMRWEKTMDSIVNRPANLAFPNLSRMKKDNEMRKLSQMEATRKSKMASRDAAALQAQRIMAKQTQNMQKKIIEGKCKFGSSVEGEEIGIMEHYRGTNTYEISGKRVLRRKDGRSHVVDPEQPDLPPWMGPMYYFDAQKNLSQSTVSERFYRLPFQVSGDGHRSTAVINRQNLTRRRKQLRSALTRRQSENELFGEESLMDSNDHNQSVSFQKSFADIKASIERDDKGEEDQDWEEVYTLSENGSIRTGDKNQHFDDHSSVGSASVMSFSNLSSAPPPSMAMSTEQSLASSVINNGNGRTSPVPFPAQLTSEDAPTHPPRKQSSVTQLNNSIAAPNTRVGHRVTLLNPTLPVLSSSLSVGSISSSTVSGTTFDSSQQSKSRGKKQEQIIDPRLTQNRHRVVLDPLMTHHAYALKILQSDPSVQQAASYGQLSTLNPHLQMYQQQKHQPNRTKDYTFHALANQKPLVLDNFNVENSVASVAQQMQQQQQQQMQQLLSGIGGSTNTSVPVSIDTPVATNGSYTSRIGTANSNNTSQLKYSSDIFKKPMVDYRTSEELWKEAKVKFNASHLVPDPFSSPGAGKVTSNSTNNNSRAGTSSSANASAVDKHSTKTGNARRRDNHGEIKVSNDALASMELSMQLLNQSRATSAAHRSTQPYGLLATVDLYSSSKPSSSPFPVDGSGRDGSPLPRHMSPPKSSPLRDQDEGKNDIMEPLAVDDFPVSVSDLLTTSEPIGHMIDEFMVSHGVHCSRDFNAYSSKRRHRKPLDTNRDGKNKSKYRSKVRGSTPANNTASSSEANAWDAASVLQELAEMKGLLLDEDPEKVYPALIQANKDRDIDNIILR